jgi:uncharacterized protein (TIGR02646 family)
MLKNACMEERPVPDEHWRYVMIHVDRSLIETPRILLSSRTEEAKRKAWAVYEDSNIQEKVVFDYSIIRSKEVMDALLRLFHSKCAYCESSIGDTQPVDIEHFRPKLRAINLDGKIDQYHYFWLAYEWNNIFSVCSECNRSKGSRFPLKNTRAPIGAGPDELAKEEALLLNPCEDAPEQHLVFSPDGWVTSSTEKGRTSIEIYGLNRTELRVDRSEEYSRLLIELEKISQMDRELAITLSELNDPARPFAGMRRQFIGEWVKKQVSRSHKPDMESAYKEVAQQPVFSSRQQQAIKSDYKRYSKEQGDYSLKNTEDKSRYYLRTRWIEKIEIHNYKIIKDLTLFPTASDRSGGPWLMLLGENGTGKSSILQAIALALIGDQYREILHINPGEVLRNRCNSGYVRIHLAGIDRPVELHFSKNSPQFQSNLPDPKILLLGYGATRLLPRDDATPRPGTEFARVENLFNPFIPLNDASRWLYDLNEKDKTKFGYVARALKNLLTLEEADELVCDPNVAGQVNMRAFGQTVSIKNQSDGYQTVLALTCDIMAILLERWEAMEVAEGIVLIDEIGSHLHPRWQMRVISSLRKVFPRVQFVVTTHYPLCLRGLYNLELVVLQRTPDNKLIIIDRDLPPIEGMRVDQLLTSEYFGLNSTLDPDLDAVFQEYYQLLALRKRNVEQAKRLAELKSRLDQFRVFGSSRRERLALEAVDQYLAKEPQLVSLDDRKDLKDETQRKVSEMWSKIRTKRETAK